ncbi:hypothetical protein AALO_G00027950 [Alosa alosa]|uniref:Unconventional myosin-XVIIIa SH3 domain-containing protein n=1 Tax=Alosa alosa TaxID=278164 RepID=A0AAV6HB86_9TELE|nr:hypothetical protein AALO_G00027950 [Alosa alosa]
MLPQKVKTAKKGSKRGIKKVYNRLPLAGPSPPGRLLIRVPRCRAADQVKDVIPSAGSKASSSDSEGSLSTQSPSPSQSQASRDPASDAVQRRSSDTPTADGKTATNDSTNSSTSSTSSGPAQGSGPPDDMQGFRRFGRREPPEAPPAPPPPTSAAAAAAAANSVPKGAKAASGPPASGKPEKDDISMGLASLMGRARTKEHRPRTRNSDRKEEEVKEEAQKTAEETKEATPAPTPAPPTPAPSTPAPAQASVTPAPPTPKPDPLAPPAGFIPAPTPKPNPLSPPPGFIPAFKANPLAPPAGFIPAPKPNPLAPPAGFIPLPKKDPFAPVAGFLPPPKPDPLAPPAGFIPMRPSVVRKPEVKAAAAASRGPAAPTGKATAGNTQSQGSAPQVAPLLVPTEENHKRLKEVLTMENTAKLEEDPVAILQASHQAATQPKVKTEAQIAAEKAWYGTEKVWLVHKDGFSLATLLKTEAGSLPEGKVKIRLEHDGSLLDVDEDDVEKANPPSLDRVEDLSSLPYLNESSVMQLGSYGGASKYLRRGPTSWSSTRSPHPPCTPKR